MKRSSSWPRRLRVLAAAATATVGFCTSVFGSVVLQAGSTAKITHEDDISGGAAANTKNVNPLPDSGSIYPNNIYSYGSRTITYTTGGNTGTSTAQGSIGAVTNSANCGFTLATGTAVTQDDPSGSVFHDDAEIKFAAKGIWKVSGSYGPNAYGYVSFTLGAVIPSGGSAEIDVDLTWTDGGSHNYRSAYHLAQAITSASTPISNALKLDGGASISNNSIIQVNGTITLLVRDPCGPVTMTPIDFEASNTPPIWKFTPPQGSVSLNFNNDTNWSNMMDEPSKTPNVIGSRALFQGTGTLAAPVQITSPTTVGMIDIDQQGVNFVGGSQLTFNTQSGNAVLSARSNHDTTGAGHAFNTPIILAKTVEVVNEAAGPIVATQPIGGPGGIENNGPGQFVLTNVNNTFAGPININNGAVTVNGATPAGGVININPGGALSGSGNGTTTGRVGNVTLNGGSIRPGPDVANGQIGTITMNTLNMLAGSIKPDIVAPGVHDRIVVQNSAVIAGPVTINPIISNLQNLATGTYTILTAGALNVVPGFSPVLAGVPTTSRLIFNLDSASVPNSLLLNVTGQAPKSIKWTGVAGSMWDLNTTHNWRDTGTSVPETYYDFDTLTFDDNAFITNITLDSSVSPASIEFNNSIDYFLGTASGAGQITGKGGLTKSGFGILTLATSNTYSGPTKVLAGILRMGSHEALSANTTLSLGADSVPAQLDLAGYNITVGGLAQTGTGTNQGITNSAPTPASLTVAGGVQLVHRVDRERQRAGLTSCRIRRTDPHRQQHLFRNHDHRFAGQQRSRRADH